ncbi:MAG: magnesium/cobalt transporter CorA [Candidatus Sericytochromatia bacterium]
MTNKHHYTKKYTSKLGMPAGSLIPITEEHKRTKIEITEYSKDFYRHLEDVEKDRIFEKSRDNTILWKNIDGIEDTEIIEEVGKKYNIHKLILEDALNSNTRPKMEIFSDYIFISLKMISFNTNNHDIDTENVSIIFGRNYLISIQEGKDGDVFDPVRNRIADQSSLTIKKGPDFLAYNLIDIIMDNYFIVLEKISEKLEELDEDLIINPNPELLQKLYTLKREIIFLRKAIWPLREVIAKLDRTDSNLINHTSKQYIRDLYDHIIQIIDTEETFRDMISGMMDLYLSSVSNKMNEIMKVLSIISTIFIPLTFIAGVYGMNFENMPELKMQYGYHYTMLGMLIIVIIMLFYFRRRKWI